MCISFHMVYRRLLSYIVLIVVRSGYLPWNLLFPEEPS